MENSMTQDILELINTPVTDAEIEEYKRNWDGKTRIPDRILNYGFQKIIKNSDKMLNDLEYMLENPAHENK
jgi:hypothetical protein